jgi:hypothetical protein
MKHIAKLHRIYSQRIAKLDEELTNISCMLLVYEIGGMLEDSRLGHTHKELLNLERYATGLRKAYAEFLQELGNIEDDTIASVSTFTAFSLN